MALCVDDLKEIDLKLESRNRFGCERSHPLRHRGASVCARARMQDRCNRLQPGLPNRARGRPRNRACAGPEVLTGSTRLKAGTVQKLILNMISTATMVGIGKAYENLMVDVQQTNEKLRARAQNIVMEATGCTREEAVAVLADAGGRVKTAVVMVLAGLDAREAESALEDSHGHVRAPWWMRSSM